MGTSDAHPADQLVTMFYTVDPSYFYVQWKFDGNNKNEKNKIRSMINTYFRNIGRVEFSATNAQLQVYRSVPVAATCLAVDSLKIGKLFWSWTLIFRDIFLVSSTSNVVDVLFIDLVWMLGEGYAALRPNGR